MHGSGQLQEGSLHVADPAPVADLHVDDGVLLPLRHRDLLGREEGEHLDAVGLVELEEGLPQGTQEVLLLLGAEDALEGEVCLGIGEGRAHAAS